MRRLGRLLGRRVIGLSVVAAFTAVAAVALSSSSGEPQSLASAAALPSINSAFPVLGQPASGADALPTAYAAQLTSVYQAVGPNIEASRKVTANDGQAAYLVPSSGGLCVINSGESFCTTTAQAAGVAVAHLCSPTLPVGQSEIEWLLPEGATNVSLVMSSGAPERFASGFNVYIAMVSSTDLPQSITWDSASGQAQTSPAPIPPQVQMLGPNCAPPAAAAAERRGHAGAPKRIRWQRAVTKNATTATFVHPRH
jgi:hypothetical protein